MLRRGSFKEIGKVAAAQASLLDQAHRMTDLSREDDFPFGADAAKRNYAAEAEKLYGQAGAAQVGAGAAPGAAQQAGMALQRQYVGSKFNPALAADPSKQPGLKSYLAPTEKGVAPSRPAGLFPKMRIFGGAQKPAGPPASEKLAKARTVDLVLSRDTHLPFSGAGYYEINVDRIKDADKRRNASMAAASQILGDLPYRRNSAITGAISSGLLSAALSGAVGRNWESAAMGGAAGMLLGGTLGAVSGGSERDRDAAALAERIERAAE